MTPSGSCSSSLVVSAEASTIPVHWRVSDSIRSLVSARAVSIAVSCSTWSGLQVEHRAVEQDVRGACDELVEAGWPFAQAGRVDDGGAGGRVGDPAGDGPRSRCRDGPELCQVAARTHGLRTLRAAVSERNAASRKVLENNGFVPVGPAGPSDLGGKHGTWFQRDLTDLPGAAQVQSQRSP